MTTYLIVGAIILTLANFTIWMFFMSAVSKGDGTKAAEPDVIEGLDPEEERAHALELRRFRRELADFERFEEEDDDFSNA